MIRRRSLRHPACVGYTIDAILGQNRAQSRKEPGVLAVCASSAPCSLASPSKSHEWRGVAAWICTARREGKEVGLLGCDHRRDGVFLDGASVTVFERVPEVDRSARLWVGAKLLELSERDHREGRAAKALIGGGQPDGEAVPDLCKLIAGLFRESG